MYKEILKSHFKDIDKVINDIYCNGGITCGSYGSITKGYGGGIMQSQFFHLLELNGYIFGLGIGNRAEAHTLMKAINIALKEEHNVPEDQLPFINLTEARI